MKFNFSDIIAAIAAIIALLSLFLSIYSTWKTSKLNKLLMKKEEIKALDRTKADLGAAFNNIGTTKYNLKIFNKGKIAARNVRIDFPEGNDCFIQGDIDRKFPLESLEPGQSVELIAAVAMQTKRKHPIRLFWSDDFAEDNEKTVYPTL